MSILRNIKQSPDYFKVEKWKNECGVETVKMVVNERDEVIGLEIYGSQINLATYPPYPILNIHSNDIIIKKFSMEWFDWIPKDWGDNVTLSIAFAVDAWITDKTTKPVECGDCSWFNSSGGTLKIFCTSDWCSELTFNNTTHLSNVYISNCRELRLENINASKLALYGCFLDLRNYHGNIDCLEATSSYINDYDIQIIGPESTSQEKYNVVRTCIRASEWEKMTNKPIKKLYVDDVMTSAKRYEMVVVTNKPETPETNYYDISRGETIYRVLK